MALSINNNIAAFNAYRNLSVTQGDLSKSLEKLSSGFRINRAADDAAGLAISEGLRSQTGGLKQAVRNSQDGISVVQTAEGALTETTSILQRMRTLSVQASSSGSLSDAAKGNIQKEIGELQSELTRISDTTQFNGAKLLDGTYAGAFQVGANTGEKINVSVNNGSTVAGADKSLSAKGLGVDLVDVTKVTTATVVPAGGAPTVATLSGNFSTVEAYDALGGSITVGTGAAAKTLDLSTVKFEATDDAAGRLGKVNAALTAAGVNGAFAGTTSLAFTSTANDAAVSFTKGGSADRAIASFDTALNTVSTVRAELGAKQNRLEHTINNLNVAVENLSASESRIRDTDMAAEMTSFTRSQILSQAGTAMLAQANQIPQGVLSLLR